VVLALTDYQFSYLQPSLLAAAALVVSLQYLAEAAPGLDLTEDGVGLENLRLRLLGISNADAVRPFCVYLKNGFGA
jgi:hypothetical protein